MIPLPEVSEGLFENILNLLNEAASLKTFILMQYFKVE